MKTSGSESIKLHGVPRQDALEPEYRESALDRAIRRTQHINNGAVQGSTLVRVVVTEQEPARNQMYLRRRARQLYQPDRVTGTTIYCGDCAGDGRHAVKTFLTVDGLCSNCGGAAVVLASNPMGAIGR